MDPIRAKKHRLPDAAYRGRKTVSFTACIEGRRPLFVDPPIVSSFVDHLKAACGKAGCLVPIYCFMPDHVHLLIQGLHEKSLPKEAMDDFKYMTGRWLAENHPQFQWQSSYHDHIIRAMDDWRKHAFYFLQNPKRAGLVEDPYAYPFTGSIGYDLVELLHDVSW